MKPISSHIRVRCPRCARLGPERLHTEPPAPSPFWRRLRRQEHSLGFCLGRLWGYRGWSPGPQPASLFLSCSRWGFRRYHPAHAVRSAPRRAFRRGSCRGSSPVHRSGWAALAAGRPLPGRRLRRAPGRGATRSRIAGDSAGAPAATSIGQRYRYFSCHPGDHHSTMSESSGATSLTTFGGRPRRRRGWSSGKGGDGAALTAVVLRSRCSMICVATTAWSRSRSACARSARSPASSSCATVSASSICRRSALIRCVTSSLARRSWPSFVSRSWMMFRASANSRSASSRASVCCRSACRAASNC